MLDRPLFDSARAYAERLGDTDFWLPYAQEALSRSGLSDPYLASGFEGTYPTLVGRRWAVKLFGHFGDWRRSVEAESAAHLALQEGGVDLAPGVVASGDLFPGEREPWPFLISERLSGQAWRDADLPRDVRHTVAAELGTRIRDVHRCRVPEGLRVRDDWLVGSGAGAAERHREWGTLPPHLVGEVPGYLAGYRPAPVCLVHGDLTEDHVFVDRDSLTGVIDWGDAMVTDPFYELAPLHMSTFGADPELLRSFLDGYGWRIDAWLRTHAMQVVLMHEFDLFAEADVPFARYRSLEALAEEIWPCPESGA
ncbi:phosphotransferase family protein [Nocardiopsis oceani]